MQTALRSREIRLAGALVHRETVLDGLDQMPAAFLGLFRGDNVGKMVVRIGGE